jgi:hypothetical protein
MKTINPLPLPLGPGVIMLFAPGASFSWFFASTS